MIENTEERIKWLENKYPEATRESRRRECMFFQSLLNEEFKRDGKSWENVYPDVLTDEEARRV